MKKYAVLYSSKTCLLYTSVETEKGAVRPRNDRRRIVPFDMAI